MKTAKITITINMSKADYDRLKAKKGLKWKLQKSQ